VNLNLKNKLEGEYSSYHAIHFILQVPARRVKLLQVTQGFTGDRGRWARRPAYGPSRARATGSEPASEPGTPGRADRDCEFQPEPESVTAAPAAVEVRSGEADSEARWE
jgi:hypothetical protein